MKVFATLLLVALCLGFGLATPQPAAAQNTCGVVDTFSAPVDGIRADYDDFARYRENFGGNHLGIDLAFDRWGDPVVAAARGKVMVSNLREWNIQKGVVVLQHILPEGGFIYTVYGHMEVTDDITFPAVGTCVERGQVIGAIGWPASGRPHLHYEIRRVLPSEGGPGYVTGNPLDQGWLHPLDYTALWQVRGNLAFRSSLTFDTVPTVPPLLTSEGGYALGGRDSLSVFAPDGTLRWSVATDSPIADVAVLEGDVVAARAQNGRVMVIDHGRYLGLWQAPSNAALRTLGNSLIFATPDGSLSAYDSAGTLLWSSPTLEGSAVVQFDSQAGKLVLAVQDASGVRWRQIIADGTVITELRLSQLDAAAPTPNGAWVLLEGTTLRLWDGTENRAIASFSTPPSKNATLAVDATGTTYLYLGDANPALVAVGTDGALRWVMPFTPQEGNKPPILAAGNGCAVYALDVNGTLHAFRGTDGVAAATVTLYPGGKRTASPQARLLTVDAAENLHVSAGFLTLVTLDGKTLSGC